MLQALAARADTAQRKVPDRQPTMDEMWQICTQYDVTGTHKSGSFQVTGVGQTYIFPRLSRDSFEVSVDSFRELAKGNHSFFLKDLFTGSHQTIKVTAYHLTGIKEALL
jgi:hypothetical protein